MSQQCSGQLFEGAIVSSSLSRRAPPLKDMAESVNNAPGLGFNCGSRGKSEDLDLVSVNKPQITLPSAQVIFKQSASGRKKLALKFFNGFEWLEQFLICKRFVNAFFKCFVVIQELLKSQTEAVIFVQAGVLDRRFDR